MLTADQVRRLAEALHDRIAPLVRNLIRFQAACDRAWFAIYRGRR